MNNRWLMNVCLFFAFMGYIIAGIGNPPVLANESMITTSSGALLSTGEDVLQVNAGSANVRTAPAGIGNRDVLWSNGPLVTTPGGGFGGADISELQIALGMNTFGGSCQIGLANRMADDFEVTSTWNINSISFFTYQTGTFADPPVSTINELNFQIWDGPPNNPGSSVVWGDTTTDQLSSTGWSGIYRVSSFWGNRVRPIMIATCDVSITLATGVYWLDWSIGGTEASGPWQPPITILGQTTTGDSMQYTSSSSAWAEWVDSGTLTPQGLPFVIEGSVTSPPGGMLYSIRDADNYLVGIDPVTLTYSVIGYTGVPDGNFGGMAYDPINEIMYWIPGRYDSNLYTLNLSTGQATLVGSHGVTDLLGLAYDSLNGVLYGTQLSGGSGLYSINMATGSATLIGTMTNQIGGLAYNSTTDVLVGIEDGIGDLYSINRSTAALALIHDGPDNDNSGLEYDPIRNYYWSIDWDGNLYYYDIDAGFTRTTVLSGVGYHDGLAMVVSAPTNTPTNTPTWTPGPGTPTDTPTDSPTQTPVPPTETPEPDCMIVGCTVFMPSHDFGAGDECYCMVYVCNTDSTTYTDIPLFVILDVYGTYFFAPSFSNFDFYDEPIPPGLTTITVLPSFPWPTGVGSAANIIWYAAMTNPAMTALHGELDVFTFGWH